MNANKQQLKEHKKIKQLVYAYVPNQRNSECINALVMNFLESKQYPVKENFFDNISLVFGKIMEFREFVKSKTSATFRYDKDAEIVNEIRTLILRMVPKFKESPDDISDVMKAFRLAHSPDKQISEKDSTNAKYCKKYIMHLMIYLKNNF